MFEPPRAREPDGRAIGRQSASPAASLAPAQRAAPRRTATPADALGASLAHAVAQRAGTRYADHAVLARGKVYKPPAKVPKVRPPHDFVSEPFDAGGFAGVRTKKVTARLAPTKVPERGKTPVALAFTGTAAPLGFDGGHVIGLHLGGENVASNVVPMYPRFNRGVWKALEDHLKSIAGFPAQLTMAVTISYAGLDPRIPSSFDVAVTNAVTGAGVLNRSLRQPDDIPLVAELSNEVRAVLTSPHSYSRPVGDSSGVFLLDANQTFAAAVASLGGKHLPMSTKALYPDNTAHRPYGELDILVLNGVLSGLGAMGPFMDFSAGQRELMLQVNRKRNGDTIKSDDPTDPCQVLDPRGAANAPEIDHIIPRVLGGSNFFSNARIVSWQLNNKEARIKPISDLVDVSRLAAPTLPSSVDGKTDVIVSQWLGRHPDTKEVVPARLREWIQTLWPALGPEGVSAHLLGAVLARLEAAGVKRPEPKKGPTKKGPTMKGVTKTIVKKKHVKKTPAKKGALQLH